LTLLRRWQAGNEYDVVRCGLSVLRRGGRIRF
jgi:hypothetical protein